MPLPDRLLSINVYLVGQQFTNAKGQLEFQASATYIMTGSNPPVINVVSFRNGDINLANEPSNPNFTSNVDVIFTLVPLMFDIHGAPVKCTWRTNIKDAITITPKDNHMSASFMGPLVIKLDDDDSNSNTYTYQLAVVLPDFGRYHMKLDPQIVNRGTGKPPAPATKPKGKPKPAPRPVKVKGKR